MMIARHPETTRVLGKRQGYLGLPIRDVIFPNGVRAMESYFTPDPNELKAINNDFPIAVSFQHTKQIQAVVSIHNQKPIILENGLLFDDYLQFEFRLSDMEIGLLNQGFNLRLTVFGTKHPPILLQVLTNQL